MTTGQWPLKRLLSEVIGSGPKSAENLTEQQAAEAMERILERESDPTTLGAYLLANRWKGNTPTELAAYLDVISRRSIERHAPQSDPVDCGANYDGKQSTALLGVGAGLVAAAAGTPIVVHSADRIPTLEGVTYKQVLESLDVPTDLTPSESAAMVDDIGFGFYYQPQFAPELTAILDRRRAMGVRTFLNTIETLLNPAKADIHLGSFYHLAFAKKLASTLHESDVGFSSGLLFQGLEGYDDIRPGQTTIALWEGAPDITADEIKTADMGLTFTEEDLSVADVATDSAAITKAVLQGDRTDALADAVALNAAIRLNAAGTVETVEAGLTEARRVLRSGAAAERLQALQSFTP